MNSITLPYDIVFNEFPRNPEYFLLIEKMFTNYFSGESRFFEIDLPDKKFEKHINTKFEYYLNIYSFTQKYWNSLHKILKNNFEFAKNFERPAQLLIYFLKNESDFTNKTSLNSSYFRSLYDACNISRNNFNNSKNKRLQSILNRLKKEFVKNDNYNHYIIDILKNELSDSDKKIFEIIENELCESTRTMLRKTWDTKIKNA